MKGKRSKQEFEEAYRLINDFNDDNVEKHINAARNIHFVG